MFFAAGCCFRSENGWKWSMQQQWVVAWFQHVSTVQLKPYATQMPPIYCLKKLVVAIYLLSWPFSTTQGQQPTHWKTSQELAWSLVPLCLYVLVFHATLAPSNNWCYLATTRLRLGHFSSASCKDCRSLTKLWHVPCRLSAMLDPLPTRRTSQIWTSQIW